MNPDKNTPTLAQTPIVIPELRSSEIRNSILSRRPVLVAPNRGFRPSDFSKPRIPPTCPFCPGNERYTPEPEVVRISNNGSASWELRGFPNKYPAAKIEGTNQFVVDNPTAITIYDAHGAHEVLVITPKHLEDLADFPVWRWQYVFQATASRITSLYGDKKIKFVQFFINYGDEAGASLEHPHAQLICLPIIPDKIKGRLARLEEYCSTHGYSVFDTLLERSAKEERIVCQNSRFVCLAPYESKFPFEMWVLPKEHKSRFADSSQCFNELAEIVKDALSCLRAVNTAHKATPPLNITIDEAPPALYSNSDEFYCWRLRILPRLTKIAGFELATDFFINPVSPEEAAEQLRKA